MVYEVRKGNTIATFTDYEEARYYALAVNGFLSVREA